MIKYSSIEERANCHSSETQGEWCVSTELTTGELWLVIAGAVLEAWAVYQFAVAID